MFSRAVEISLSAKGERRIKSTIPGVEPSKNVAGYGRRLLLAPSLKGYCNHGFVFRVGVQIGFGTRTIATGLWASRVRHKHEQ